MKMALFELGKKPIYLQNFQNLLDRIDMSLVWVFYINENILQVDNDKEIFYSSPSLILI